MNKKLYSLILSIILLGTAGIVSRAEEERKGDKTDIAAAERKDSTSAVPLTWQASPIIELQPGKKLLKVADLNMPGDITLGDLLNMFPELLSRSDEDLLQTFDLQIDDITTGASKETMLTQLRVADIKEIELSVNPSASNQVNGQGGVINITLNDHGKGFTGDVMLQATSEWDVTPAFKMSYNTDKLQLHGMVSGEYYSPRDYNSQEISLMPSGEKIFKATANDLRFAYEFAKFNLVYSPDSRNRLKAWIWETYQNESTNVDSQFTTGHLEGRTSDNLLENFTIAAGANYRYSFKRGYFETELGYQYDPSTNRNYTYVKDVRTEAFNDINRPHDLNWLAKGRYQIIPTTSTRKCELTCGVNARYLPKAYSFTDSLGVFASSTEKLNVSCKAVYASPYAEVDAMLGPVFIKGGLRYQFYQYYIALEEGEGFSLPQNKLTGYLNLGWQIVPHHHLSFIADKSIRRPDNQQVYPGTFYDPDADSFVKGNQELGNENIYTVSLDYEYDFSGNGHTVLAGCGLRYNRVSDVITTGEQVRDTLSYINDGYCDVLTFNAMAVYAHGPFKVTFTGNLLQNWTYIGGVYDNYFNYNLSIMPMLFFPTGDWRISGKFEYNSNVRTVRKDLGHYFYSEVRLSKGFKKWNVYLRLTDNFHRVVDDYIYNSDGTYTLSQHYLHLPGFGLGANFTF